MANTKYMPKKLFFTKKDDRFEKFVHQMWYGDSGRVKKIFTQ